MVTDSRRWLLSFSRELRRAISDDGSKTDLEDETVLPHHCRYEEVHLSRSSLIVILPRGDPGVAVKFERVAVKFSSSSTFTL